MTVASRLMPELVDRIDGFRAQGFASTNEPSGAKPALLNSHKVDNHLRKLRPLIFLQEMSGVSDRRMRLIFRARHQFKKRFVSPARNRVAVAESCEKWLLPFPEDFPSGTIGGRCRIIRRGWHQLWKRARPCFVRRIQKRGVISCNYVRC